MKAILVVIVVVFLTIPSIVDFLMGKFVTVMDREHWFSFFGSYLGGGIAALITLFGIYWQLFEISKKDKKDKLEGILSYIHYVLNKNKEIKFKYEIFNDLLEIEIREELFKSFKKSFLEENFKEIFSRKEGIRIAELIEEIDKYNEDYLRYIDEHIKLEDRIEKLIIIIRKSKLNIETKDNWIEILLKGKDIILTLNYHNDLVRISMNEQINNRNIIDKAKVFEKIKSIFQDNTFSLINMKPEFKVILNNPIKKFNQDYDNLIDLNFLFQEKVEEPMYEEYLKRLIKLEEAIFVVSNILLIDKEMSTEEMSQFNKEKEKIGIYFRTKINLLERKNKILGKIKKESIEIEKIIENINK